MFGISCVTLNNIFMIPLILTINFNKQNRNKKRKQ